MSRDPLFVGKPWWPRAAISLGLLVCGIPPALAAFLIVSSLAAKAILIAPPAVLLVLALARRGRTVLEIRGGRLRARTLAPPHVSCSLRLADIEALELRSAPPQRWTLEKRQSFALCALARDVRAVLFASTDRQEVVSCGTKVLAALAAAMAQPEQVHPRAQQRLASIGTRAVDERDLQVDLSVPALWMWPRRPPAPWERLGTGARFALAFCAASVFAAVVSLPYLDGAAEILMLLGALLVVPVVAIFKTAERLQARFDPESMLGPIRNHSRISIAELAEKQPGELVLISGVVSAIDPPIESFIEKKPAVLTLINTARAPQFLVGPNWNELDPEVSIQAPRAVFAISDNGHRIEVDASRAHIALPSTALRREHGKYPEHRTGSPLDHLAVHEIATELPHRYRKAGPLEYQRERAGAYFHGPGSIEGDRFSPHYLDESVLAVGDAVVVLGRIEHHQADATSPQSQGGYREAGRAAKLVIAAQIVGPA